MKRNQYWLSACLLLTATPLYATQVFYSDFEDGILPPEMSANGASIQNTQGYGALANLANPTYVFGDDFLRYDALDIDTVSLSLTNLPAHNSVSIGLLLAIIDSWDGTERLDIRLDGNLIFAHTWSIAQADTSSYVPPPGGLLSSGVNLGFSSGTFFARDRAYDLSLDTLFQDIPHTTDTLTLEFVIGSANSGSAAENWQGGADESWAIDNLTVTVNTTTLQGDLDGDGFVGINDLNIVLANWNQNVPPANPLADPSGDGFVGINDLNTVLSNWNAGTPPPPGTANIPEPGTLVLLGLSGVAALRRSRA